MTWARTLALVIIVIMSALAVNIAITDSMAHGVGLDTFLAGAGNPWQLFINQDLVSGLLLTVGWIIYRERGNRAIDTVAWVWMAAWWGNIVVASYILLAVAQSRGNAAGFFLGRRGNASLRVVWAAPGMALRCLCVLIAAAAALYLVHALRAAAAPVSVVGDVLAFSPIILSALLLASARSQAVAPLP